MFDCFRWRMQYKWAELKRAYNSWSAEIQQKTNMMRMKLQRWSDDVCQRLTDWWRYNVQPHLDASKTILMGAYNVILG